MPAAGIGKRMASDIPKQYLKINGQSIIEYSLQPLLEHAQIKQVVVALSADDVWFRELPVAQHSKITIVIGGKERCDTVLNALKTISEPARVLVHDAARPCLTNDDLSQLICAQTNKQGAILASQVRDTMKRGDSDGLIVDNVERELLYHALTPQLFMLSELQQALSGALANNVCITDEASAMQWAGHGVKLVMGRSDNIKVTRPEDLQLATLFLTQQQRITTTH
ncbi:MAG: 2-C-methyl-D-erythritol 4-phosphate cytidylyltransferase [Psychrobium sp.]|nr:2-C-methyl-D-erythritol 4-phosphate cytidylyltransferase [Psychrobium sp.]